MHSITESRTTESSVPTTCSGPHLRKWRRWALGAALAVGLAPPLLAQAPERAEAPLAVSPGGPAGGATAQACPTFSWGAVPKAAAYELVIYEIGNSGAQEAPVRREVFAGAVTSWTPDLDRCLERGRHYAWSVRAQIRQGGKRPASDWSAPRLFTVAAGPSAAEFEAAISVVHRYLAERGKRGEATRLPPVSQEPFASADAGAAVGAEAAGVELSVTGGVEAAFFAGDGSDLTGLDPAALSAGTASIDIDGNAATATTAADLSCTDCIDGSQLDRASVGSREIATGGVESSDVADNSLTAADLAPGSVDKSELAEDAVTKSAIAYNQVGSHEIEDNSITANDIGPNAVNSSELIDHAVLSRHILDEQIDSRDIKSGAVKESELADGAVSGGKLADLTLVRSDGIRVEPGQYATAEVLCPGGVWGDDVAISGGVNCWSICLDRPLYVIRSAPAGTWGWQATVYNAGLVEDAHFTLEVRCLEG